MASPNNHASATTTTMVTVPDRAVNTHTSAADVLGSIPRKTAMNHQSRTKEFMEPPINNRTQPTKSENEVSLNPGVVTPVNVSALEMWLQGYDSATSKFLLDGFTFWFKITYCGSRQFRHYTNLQSAKENINILQQKIDLKVQKGRAAGPFSTSTLPFRNLQISPLGLVPKQKPGEFRVIHHFSFPEELSINDGISKEFSAVTYQTVDNAVTLMKRIGKGHYLQKLTLSIDIKTFPSIQGTMSC